MLKIIIGALPTVIIPFLVIVTLNIFFKSTTTDSLDKFEMRMSKFIFIISFPCFLIFGFCLYGSTVTGQISWLTTGLFTVFTLLGVFLSLLPIKGLFEYSVDGNVLTCTKLWSFKKSIFISDIDHCTIVNGGIKVYIRGRKKPVMSIESVFSNSKNFISRIQRDNIPIENKTTGFYKEM